MGGAGRDVLADALASSPATGGDLAPISPLRSVQNIFTSSYSIVVGPRWLEKRSYDAPLSRKSRAIKFVLPRYYRRLNKIKTYYTEGYDEISKGEEPSYA